VTVAPAGLIFEPEPGETVFDAARRLGYVWPTLCGGLGTCRTCYVTVQDGVDHCAPMPALEQEAIDALGRPRDGRTRLACQLHIDGPIVVTRRGVRRLEG